MILRRLRRSLEKNRNELLGLALARYPAFVLGDAAPEGIPVFQFHGVREETLEPLLQHIARNDYRTLTADEYFERAPCAPAPGGREVLLTFDDGERSLHSVAFPILRRLGQKAVAYVVPGRVPPAEGHAAADGLCGWRELEEMHRSGVIDVQSHSMYHHSIATSSRVLDFLGPHVVTSFLAADLSPRTATGPERWGLPLHAWGPRLGAVPAFREAPEAEEACIAHVARHGGGAFFHRRGWRRRLMRVLDEARRRHPPPAPETAEEQRAAILADLQQSRRAIEAALPGKAVRHFCFPWYRGSSLAVALSREAGYVTNAWASILPQFLSDGGGHLPVPIARLAPRYIWRLPGVGRRSLLRTLGS